MKITFGVVAVIASVLSGANATDVNEDTFLTVEDYPYDYLVRLSDKVLIHYSDVKEGVKCRTEVQHKGETWSSNYVIVETYKFRKDAFRACYKRSEAKASLTRVFSNR